MSSTVWGLIPGRWTDLTVPQNDRTSSGAHILSSLMNDGISSPENKVSSREADRPLSSRAEYKNKWSYTSIPHIHFPVTKTEGRLMQFNLHLLSELYMEHTKM